MSRKAETIFTASMQNQAARQQRKVARAARCQARAFQEFAPARHTSDVFYVNVSGVTMPLSHRAMNAFMLAQ